MPRKAGCRVGNVGIVALPVPLPELAGGLRRDRVVPADHRIKLGETGEELACRELRRRGYAVVARRFRTRFGEIDIIARDGETLVFVEVKARSSPEFGAPAEAVTPRKQHTISLMASEYLLRTGSTAAPCRFDVVAVMMGQGRPPRVEVFPGAFDATAFVR